MPSERSLSRKLNDLGFKPRRVAKSKPLRKVPETDAIVQRDAPGDGATGLLSALSQQI